MVGVLRTFGRGFAAVVAVGLFGPVPALPAQDHGGHAHHGERVELSFGRTEDYDYDPPEPGSYSLPAIKKAGGGAVLDAGGAAHDLADLLQGHVTLLAFIYTRCEDPEGCPMSLSLLYDIQYVREQDPLIGSNLSLIAMSFDPDYDTPEVIAQYGYGKGDWAREKQDILYLTTRSQKELAPILKAYDQAIGKKDDADDPFGPLTHQLRVYLIDKHGWIRNIYSLGFLDPRLVVTDIRTLLMESRADKP